MSDDVQTINDNSDPRKYFSMLIHMAPDDLTPFELALYVHYQRVCGLDGACWETVRTTAEKTKMSVGQVVDTRNRLATSGWITIHQADNSSRLIITIVDRWAENMQRYAPQRSPDELDVHPMNMDDDPCSPDERHLKNEPDLTDEEETPEEELPLPPVFDGDVSSPAPPPPPPAGGDGGSVIIQGIELPLHIARMEPGELLAQEGYTITRTLADTLDDWLQTHPREEVNAAIYVASMQGVRKPSYLNAILQRWHSARSPAGQGTRQGRQRQRGVDPAYLRAMDRRVSDWDEIEH